MELVRESKDPRAVAQPCRSGGRRVALPRLARPNAHPLSLLEDSVLERADRHVLSAELSEVCFVVVHEVFPTV